MRLFLFIPSLFLIISCSLLKPAARISPYSSSKIKKLSSLIDEVLNDILLKYATCGVYIVSLNTGQILYEKNSSKLLLPASNMKLITAFAALKTLGPSYKFETHFYIDSVGNLYIKGYGDPTLSYKDLLLVGERLKAKGLKEVENVVVDDFFFDSLRLGPGWMWDEGPYPYTARIGALSLSGNVVEVWVRPGDREGNKVRVSLIPPTKCIDLEINAITLPEDSVGEIIVDRIFDEKNVIIVEGGIPFLSPPKVFYRNIEEPALYTGSVFKEILEMEGICVKGIVLRDSVPDFSELLYIHRSPPLSEIVMELNKVSSNFIAEQILKTLGAIVFGPPGTWEKGRKVILNFLQEMGLDSLSTRIVDGSGLSRYNLLSAAHIVDILVKAAKDFTVFPEFTASLPIGGIDGTLSLRMQDTLLRGKVRAKTGTLWGVSSLSGYVESRNNDIIVFSILINNFLCSEDEVRRLQDKIVGILARFPEV
jgi:D-alanyl-D-alanine carboxypeptidase/D-alanyl-D-alanine-endopeptidase (penicillin-binding protein 4)